jgi:hypothetical protein
MVAILLAALVFIAIPSGDSAEKHRALVGAVDDMDRSIRFAGNESILRNTVVRLRISLDKNPIEYTVEYGPAGNLPLPDMSEPEKNLSLDEEKARLEKSATLDRQFTTVPEFEEIKRELDDDVTILAVASTTQKNLIQKNSAFIYFYPTGEKDGALIFLSTVEELAYLEVSPFLQETNATYDPLKTNGVAKVEDIIQTKMDEVYKEWLNK